MKRLAIIPTTLAISLLSLALPLSAATNQLPFNNMGLNPMSGGMGMPWSSGFSPWSMGGNPGSSSFSPWSMGGAPWSSGASPWGGNGWNSSLWPWSGSGWGNSSGNNSWMPWSNGSSFFGRQNNNNDWLTTMLLMNSLNNQQQPLNMGLMPNYPSQASVWNQSLPAQQPQTLFYPQLQAPQQIPNMANPAVGQHPQSATAVVNFPAASSSFSPFIEPSTSENSASTTQSNPTSPNPKPPAKTLVFPDGTTF